MIRGSPYADLDRVGARRKAGAIAPLGLTSRGTNG
jgi:hypothetical protein